MKQSYVLSFILFWSSLADFYRKTSGSRNPFGRQRSTLSFTVLRRIALTNCSIPGLWTFFAYWTSASDFVYPSGPIVIPAFAMMPVCLFFILFSRSLIFYCYSAKILMNYYRLSSSACSCDIADFLFVALRVAWFYYGAYCSRSLLATLREIG